MKKNLILAVCFTLLLGIPAMADQMDGFDSIIAWGNFQGNCGADCLNYIMQTYVDENFGGFLNNDALNYIPPAALPLVGETKDIVVYLSDSVNGDVPWTYLVLASNSDKYWYLFKNDYVIPGKEIDLLDNDGNFISIIDYFLTIPEANGTFYSYYDSKDQLGKDDDTYGAYTFVNICGTGKCEFNQVDVTIWIPTAPPCDPNDPDCNPFRGCTPDQLAMGMVDWNGECCDPADPDAPCSGGETPEPGTILLLGTGIVGLGFVARRKLTKK